MYAIQRWGENNTIDKNQYSKQNWKQVDYAKEKKNSPQDKSFKVHMISNSFNWHENIYTSSY